MQLAFRKIHGGSSSCTARDAAAARGPAAAARGPAAAAAPASRHDKFHRAIDYETPMLRMKEQALRAAALYKLSHYSGICGLTWATVVLLGGFASSLKPLDFYLVAFSLLLQALQFTVSSIFRRLLSAHLFRESHHPNAFAHRDHQHRWVSNLHKAGQISSFLVAASVLLASFLRLFILPSFTPSLRPQSIRSIAPNLFLSLISFYSISMLTSVLAILASLFQLARRSSSHDPAAVAFYDHVYLLALDTDLASAFSMDPLTFAFAKLRSDHIRRIKPIAIAACNADVIKYIYNVPCGIEMAFQDLNSEDMYKQLVAVNLARFWSDQPRMEKQVAYFVEIAKKLIRPEKMAEAAADTLELLAELWVDYPALPPAHVVKSADVVVNINELISGTRTRARPRQHPFLEARVVGSSGKTIVDLLVELVVNPWRTSLVFQLRALESCCRNKEVVAWIRGGAYGGPDQCRKLCTTLLGIIEGPAPEATRAHSKPKQRTKIYAASILLHLLRSVAIPDHRSSCDALGDPDVEDKRRFESSMKNGMIDPANGSEEYVWKKEVILLDMVRMEIGLPPYDWTSVNVRDPEKITLTNIAAHG